MADSDDLGAVVPGLLHQLGGVTGVELRGSRQRGDAGRFSDWDFVVWTTDFAATARELPATTTVLRALAAQWDRLSDEPCFMFILPGPVKVDVIFDGRSHVHEPPWRVEAQTLPGIDEHFWDWALWLSSKVDSGKSDLVRGELVKMHEHLLAPLGIGRPTSLPEAVDTYRSRLGYWEQRLHVSVDRTLDREIQPVIELLRR